MYSFAIKIAIDVNKAVELVNTLPIVGFINDIVEVVIVDPDPNYIPVIYKSTLY